MAAFVLTDAKIWLDSLDISGVSNTVNLEYAAEALDETTFGDDTRINRGGLKTVALGASGFFNEGLVTDGDGAYAGELFDNVGFQDTLISVAAEGGQAGETAYFFQAFQANYNPSGAVGDLFAFSVDASAGDSGKLIRGTILANLTSQIASGSGSGFEVGAASSSQTVFAGLHVLQASGSSPTLDINIESDATNAFIGAETTRFAFTQATGRTNEYLTLAGPITDPWYRIDFTIAGGSPSFDFVVNLGIL